METLDRLKRRLPLLVPLRQLVEAKIAVGKVTPKRVTIYVKDPKDPDDVKAVAIKHSSIPKYASKAVDPPLGSKYEPVGLIDTDTYTGPEDLLPLSSAEPGGPPVKKAMPTGQPDPDKFVPVFDWDNKYVHVFVKKPGGKTPVGPTKVPHKKIKAYAGKLGWLPQKMLLVGKIDPGAYSGPDDIYPLDWEPDDGPPPFIPTSAHAVQTVFQPGAAKPAELTSPTKIMKPKAKPTAAEPSGQEFAADEFEYTGMKDFNGYPMVKDKASGAFWSVLPGGKLATYDASAQVYYKGKKAKGGWVPDHGQPAIDPKDVGKKPQPKGTPEGYEHPEGYEITSISSKKVFATTPDGEKVVWIKKLDSWWNADKPWQEHTPPAKSAVQPAPKKKTPIPAGAPAAPIGFEIVAGPNKHGTYPLRTDEYHDDGTWFVLQNGVLVKYNGFAGTYQPWKHTDAGWMEAKVKPLPVNAVKMLKYYPPQDLPIPEGYSFVGYDTNGLPTVQKGGGTAMTLLPTGNLASWNSGKQSYTISGGLGKLTLDQIEQGDFGPDKPAPAKVADQPEPAPAGVEYTGQVDDNGYPVVDEVFEDPDYDEEYAEKGLTLLPDDRVARWKPFAKTYRLYSYNEDGYTPSKKMPLEISAEDVERLMNSLGLTVQNGKYHKVEVAESGPDVPEGFEALTPTEDEAGLVPMKHIATGHKIYLLPGGIGAATTGSQVGDVPTFITADLPGQGPSPEAGKILSLAQVKLLTAGHAAEAPDHTTLLDKTDFHGFPMVKTLPEVDEDDEPEEGEILTLLPKGELARWNKKADKYQVWHWDHWAGDYVIAHPVKYYSLKEVLKQKKKLAPGKPAPVTPIKAPEPAKPQPAAPTHPWEDPDSDQYLYKLPKGDKNGYDRYWNDFSGISLTKIPAGTGWGKWSSSNKAYRVYHWVGAPQGYAPKMEAGGNKVWWIPGSPDVYVGKLDAEGQPASKPVPASALSPTGKSDPNGYPMGYHKKTDAYFSMLPDGVVARWKPEKETYLPYTYDAKYGLYVPTKKTVAKPGAHAWAPVDQLKSPDGYNSKAAAAIKDSTGKRGVVIGPGMYAVWNENDDYTVHIADPNTQKLLQTGQKLTMGELYKKAKSAFSFVEPTGDVDPNGLPMYADEEDYEFSFLPNGEFAEWNKTEEVYELLEYDDDHEAYFEAVPAQTFTLDDVKAMQIKVAAGYGVKLPKSTQAQAKAAAKAKKKAAAAQPPAVPKPKGPTPAEQAKAAKKAAQATDEDSAGELIKGLAGKLPDPSTLTKLGDGNSMGLGGAGKKTIYKDPATGQRFIFKPAIAKGGSTATEAFRAHSQEAAAALALKVRNDHVPVKTVTINGQLGTLQPMVELADPDTVRAAHLSPTDLTEQQKKDVATDHLLDWMQSQHDSHSGNMVITKDGRILSIDKEQGFKYFSFDKLDTDFHPNSKYGEEEPYYNKFWRAFAKGEMDFDPMELAGPLNKIEHMDSKEYVASVRPYAESVFPGDVAKQDRFLEKVLRRKLQLRRDFERFVTAQYRKRTGEEKGVFTFEHGWAPPGAKKTKTIHFTAEEYAAHNNIKFYNFQHPETGAGDDSILVLKLDKAASQKVLIDFMEEVGVEPIEFSDGKFVTGQIYHLVRVPKDKVMGFTVTKEVEEDTELPTPPAPKYWPDATDPVEATDNAHEWKEVGKPGVKLGRGGKRIRSDGPHVEGQVAKTKTFIDGEGRYHFVHLKLRPHMWKSIAASSKTHADVWTFKGAKWDPGQDAFVEYGEDIHTVKTVSWTAGPVEAHVVNETGKWSYMGSVYMKVRTDNVAAAVKKAFDFVKPKLAADIFRNPTPEEKEIHKLSQLLWSYAPQEADALPREDKRTVEDLQNRLMQVKGFKKEWIDQVESEEVFPGLSAHVLPGRWKTMGGGKFKYLFNGVRTLEAAIGIMSGFGLIGIHERNISGIAAMDHSKAGSASDDVQTGSGDNILTRVVCIPSGEGHSLSGHGFSGRYQAIIHPSALDRLDTYCHPSDCFGTCRPSKPPSAPNYSSEWKNRNTIDAHLKSQAQHHSGGRELGFRRGIPTEKILRLTCQQESDRKQCILHAKQAGLTEVNGVPVEDFVVVANDLGKVYTKYVKPLGI